MSDNTLPPFAERFEMLLAEAMLRQGTVGSIQGYGSVFEPNVEAYAKYGLKVEGGTWMTRPRLSDGRCPKCRGSLAVTNVTESTSYRFAGTFVDRESFQHASGRLICRSSPEHLAKMPYGWTDVSLDGTIAELIPSLSEIADEMGW
jgi:hypothetical protein